MTALEQAVDDLVSGAAEREHARGELRKARARELVELLDVVRRRRGNGRKLDQLLFFELEDFDP